MSLALIEPDNGGTQGFSFLVQGFWNPGLLKGALLVRARKISDGMAIRCAHSIADFAEKRGIDPDNIIAKMNETDVFAIEVKASRKVLVNDLRGLKSFADFYGKKHTPLVFFLGERDQLIDDIQVLPLVKGIGKLGY